MATLGQIGDIPFEVSSKKVMSFNSFTRTDSPRVSEINYINKRPGTQYNGTARSTGSFTLPLFSSLGVDIEDACLTLRGYAKQGKALKFILGGKSVFFKDVRITSLETSFSDFDGKGKPIAATANVSVEEV